MGIKRQIIGSYLYHRRMKNAIGSYFDYRLSLILRKAIVRNFPPALMIEPTNICNLKCPLCPSGNGSLKRDRGMMKLPEYRKIIDQVYKDIGILILWNQGEPYLNADFDKMVRYATEKKMFTMTSTNASLEMDHMAIVQSGLGKIIISMDGISEETYDRYRVNGDFSLVLENLKRLVAAKQAAGTKHPYIVWQFIVMRHNEHEIPYVKQMAKSIGVDKLEFKTVQIYSKDDIAFLPKDHKLSRYSANEQSFELRTKLLNRCRRLWTQPVINWDSELSICCYDKDLHFKIGNVHEHSFRSLWFSSRFAAIRQSVLSDRAAIEICRNCGEGIVQNLDI